MKKYYITLVLLSVFLATNVLSQSKVLSDKEVETIEEQVDKLLQSPQINNDKKLTAYTLAGREFYQYRFYDKAKKYYQAAIKVNTTASKTEAYINLVAIALVTKNKKELQNRFDETQNYFNKNKKLKTNEVSYYLDSIEDYLSGKNKNNIKGFYGRFVEDANLAELIKSKKYSDALSVLNPEGLDPKGMNSLEFISYDVLNVYVNKKNVKNLYCSNEFRKYPNAYTYSVLLCGLLNDYLTKSVFDESRMKRALNYFSEVDREKSYLLDVVKEIK